jgi:uncharacterized protein (DUF362 family)/Pyruvate/2-oxoacid:ferredoxin oxidoreductase delta subunit
MDKRVALLPCADYSATALDSCFREAMRLAPPPDVRGKRVLLKPNILKGAGPEKAVCTHPEFVAAAIRAFRALGAERITVGDSPGYPGVERAAVASGISAAIAAEGAEEGSFMEGAAVENPAGRLVKRFKFAHEWFDAEIVVSLAKLKTHALMRYTGAMKNLFGLVPGLEKPAFHFRFPDKATFGQMLADLALCADADYALMDGITAMEGPGPGSGYSRHAGVIMASENLLALDEAACRVIGYEPSEIHYLARARDMGHWLKPGEEAEILGLPLEEARVHGFKLLPESEHAGFQKYIPSPLRALARRLLVPRPVFRHSVCLRCSACIDICPAKALSYEPRPAEKRYGKRIKIDYDACIRCYCCHEVCPADAIRLRRG